MTLRIDDVVDFVSDRVGPTGPGWIGLEHLVADQLRLEGAASKPARRGRRFQEGDLLFSGLRPGRTRVAQAQAAGVCSPEILVLRPRSVPSGLALAALAHPATTAAASQRAAGTRMPRIRWDALRSLPAPLPPRGQWATTARAVQALTRRLEVLHARDRADARLLRAAVASELTADDLDGPRLSEVLTHRGGAIPRGTLDPQTACVGLRDLPADGLGVHAPARSPGTGSYMPMQPGDVLLPLLRPGTARLGLAPRHGVASAEIFALAVDPAWAVPVIGWLLTPSARIRWRHLATGTRMPRIARADILATRLPVGPEAARRLSPLRPLVERARHSPAQAHALRTLRHQVVLGHPAPRDPRPSDG